MEGKANDHNEVVLEYEFETYSKSEIEEIHEDEDDDRGGSGGGSGSGSGGGSSGSGGGGGGGGGGYDDVYVAVGKDDLEVLKWTLDHHAVSFPGARINLIHIYPPLCYISTPVGRLRASQLSPEQMKVYASEEENKRRNLLHKYIRLCVEYKVNVDTLLIESNETTKAILHLVRVLHINSLVMGKHPHPSRRLMKGSGKGILVQKNAPDHCKVILVYIGKKQMSNQAITPQITSSFLASNEKESKTTIQTHKKPDIKECSCFPVKFY